MALGRLTLSGGVADVVTELRTTPGWVGIYLVRLEAQAKRESTAGIKLDRSSTYELVVREDLVGEGSLGEGRLCKEGEDCERKNVA